MKYLRLFENFDFEEDWEEYPEYNKNDFYIGEIVDLNLRRDRFGHYKIPYFYGINVGIPRNLLSYGNIRVDINYPIEIVDKYKDYYIVKYKDIDGKFNQLGFRKYCLKKK